MAKLVKLSEKPPKVYVRMLTDEARRWFETMKGADGKYLAFGEPVAVIAPDGTGLSMPSSQRDMEAVGRKVGSKLDLIVIERAGAKSWMRVKVSVMNLEQHFPNRRFSEDRMRAIFEDKDGVNFVVRSPERGGGIIAHTYAGPITKPHFADLDQVDKHLKGGDLNTVLWLGLSVDKGFRGRGIARLLCDTWLNEIPRQENPKGGKYNYIALRFAADDEETAPMLAMFRRMGLKIQEKRITGGFAETGADMIFGLVDLRDMWVKR